MRKAQSDSLKIDSYAAEAGLRQCDAPGCREPGEHRAPKSRDRLEDYYWFCLDHVRSYNKQWNYYEGVSPEELEQAIRRSTTWDRPTWPLGAAAAYRKFVAGDYRDPFGALNGDEEMGPPPVPARPVREPRRRREKLSQSWGWSRRFRRWS
jgi:hypothetical protein